MLQSYCVDLGGLLAPLMSIIFYHIGEQGLFHHILRLKGFNIDKIWEDRYVINFLILIGLFQRTKCEKKTCTRLILDDQFNRFEDITPCNLFSTQE